MDYPRWLYSKDHGSVLVDTPDDAVNLPDSDWYASPAFTDEPLIARFNIADTTATDGPREPLYAEAFATVVERQAEDFAKIDKRTKAYKDSQK